MGCKKFNRKNQNSGNQKFNTYNKHNDEFVDIDDDEFDMINITDSDYEEDMFEYDDMIDVKINETKFTDNKLKPQSGTTRAETAMILKNYFILMKIVNCFILMIFCEIK